MENPSADVGHDELTMDKPTLIPDPTELPIDPPISDPIHENSEISQDVIQGDSDQVPPERPDIITESLIPDSNVQPTNWGYAFLSFFVVLGCFFSNMSFVFGRSSTSIICAQMVNEGLISASNLGQIIAAGMSGMFLGAFGFGLVMDVIGTKWPTLISIVVGAGLMVLVYFFPTFWGLCIIYFIFNLFAMAAHASMSKVAREWVPPARHGLALGFMATSSNAGRIVGLLVLGTAYQLGMSWKYSTLIISAFLGVVFAYYIIIFFLEYKFKIVNVTKKEQTPHPLDGKDFKFAIIYFVSSMRFWVAILISMAANSSMDAFSFLPLFITETQHVSTGLAGYSSSAFAIGSTISIFAVGALEDRIGKFARIILYLIMLSIATVVSGSFVWPYGGYWVTTILLFFLGLMLAASSYVSYNTFLVQFGGPYAGTLYSVMETSGSVARVVFDLTQGYLIQNLGWQSFWIGTTVIILFNNLFVFIFLIILYKTNEFG